ncbi:DUF2252 family protein [Tessaracoccus sp. HDW20]|uniref:DUF2252 family protein n=1 Tax=Tessaracoccus coleopterorum TaxID=2714950 RepID=UPI0018D391E4|nr:DUF2252 family protein [Tessaracoccus coleopterorum]NHB86104.1 DUF2252 family protein [Tessaracoccus coleopterorum]
MSQSVFTFYRGTAAIMAADLASAPHSGILVASCGDAHINNFGFYASPQRTLLFDLNDFDEAAWAPWEWDLKRLVTSVILSGESAGRDAAVVARAARRTVNAYLGATRGISELDPVDRYYTHFDPTVTMAHGDRSTRRVLKAAVADATKRTGARAARRLTEQGVDGELRFIENPPVVTHPAGDTESVVRWAYATYLASANADVRLLLNTYEVTDVARRAVGVGSVGTRCFVVLVRDGDGHTLILQTKQANRSVLEQYGGIVQPRAVASGSARTERVPAS